MTATSPPLVLASTSPFRKQLLARLGIGFQTVAPDVDETALPGETPVDLVTRLAVAKARAVGNTRQGLIIGSDQVATTGSDILGKPGSHERAAAQLAYLSGRRVTFHTGLCLLNSTNGDLQADEVPYHVMFRTLAGEQIERYLRAEQPYNCAGSFKSEGLGITLFERMEGDDPTALIGLPLIRLTHMLALAGIDLP
ncbi:MAG TPA: Maf family nucleotide pyrophosphatase [Gammaproteobacteria bacterium]|nr:Maf family nucleotide pyrophosphatase [Gammaproteobacteria bacterium]